MPEIGLAVEVDEEEELLDADWQQRKVALLLGILDRTELRSALALAVAGATNVNKTWDTTAGKDPDQDIATEINAMQIPPNNIWYRARRLDQADARASRAEHGWRFRQLVAHAGRCWAGC
jgi:hypothetical protein